jgi:hypothetical protein
MGTGRWSLGGWFSGNRPPLVCGVLAGALWGFLTGSGATPRAWLTLDVGRHVVIIERPELRDAITVSADYFIQTYTDNLIQVTLTFLILCIVAGWVAWQLSRIRPRGQSQPRLGWGLDVYGVMFLISGLGAVLLFQELSLGNWFRGQQPTPAVVITGVIGFLLPLFDGIGAFLIWFLRLESVRAPDWDTRFPPPRDWLRPLFDRLLNRSRLQGKGGKRSD